MKYQEVINKLIIEKSDTLKEFNEKIIKTKYQILGLKMSLLDSLVKELDKKDYLKKSKDKYYEEVLLKGMVLAKSKDINGLLEYTSLIDNWALVDTVVCRMKYIKNDRKAYLEVVDKFFSLKSEFASRFAFVILLNYYVEEEYFNLLIDYIKKERTSDYYNEMAIAWLLSKMYLKNKEKTKDFLLSKNLSDNILKMTLSKIRDLKQVRVEEVNSLKRLVNS